MPERLGDPLEAARFYLYFISISFPIILYVMLLQYPSAPLQLLFYIVLGRGVAADGGSVVTEGVKEAVHSLTERNRRYSAELLDLGFSYH